MKEQLLAALYNQKNRIRLPQGIIEREIFSSFKHSFFNDKRINIVSGLRRTGKSTLIKQLMLSLDNYIFINFDDERLFGFKAEDFEQLNEAAIMVYGASENYFFDEIQNVDGFEIFIRRLQDEGKKVVITGSNASLLSMEFGTRLTGRYKMFELYPFSFAEYLCFKGVEIIPETFYNTEQKVKLTSHFTDWLDVGGLPEYLIFEDDEYVKTLFDNIIYRDIVARYGIKKTHQLQELIHLLISNLSLPITYNSLKNTLKLSNADTVREYIGYLSNSWLFFELRRYSHSVKQQLRHPRKIYVIDIAFNRLVGFNTSANIGRRLENIVFTALRRISSMIYYFNDNGECDFVLKQPDGTITLYQACYNLNNDNRKRELNGLLAAMLYFNSDEGNILTYNQEEEIEYHGKAIKVTPVWKWMLKTI